MQLIWGNFQSNLRVCVCVTDGYSCDGAVGLQNQSGQQSEGARSEFARRRPRVFAWLTVLAFLSPQAPRPRPSMEWAGLQAAPWAHQGPNAPSLGLGTR